MSAEPVGGTTGGATEHTLPLAPGWRIWRTAALRGAGLPFGWLAPFATDPATGRSAAVRGLLGEDRFVEALVWQNPGAARNWVLRHAAALRDGTELTRRGTHDALAARYAQRYCAKNDTIGFFGPVAWARLDDAGRGVTATGDGDIRHRSVYMETWAVQALADAWAADDRVRPHLPVRVHPAVAVEGRLLRRGWRAAEELTPAASAALAAVHEQPTVEHVVDAVQRVTGDRERALAEVTRLEQARVVDIGFVVRLHERPDRDLRRQVDNLPDGPARRELLARMDELEQGLTAVARAAGDPAAVHEALGTLIAFLVKETSHSGTREKGEVSFGRVPVYQDCRRDLDVGIGADLLDRLRAPLAVLLRSARWLVAETAGAVHEELRRRYQDLSARDPDVRLAQLYTRAADVLSGSPGTVVHDVVEDFHLRWAELLATGRGTGCVQLSTVELEQPARDLFPDRAQLWSAGRYHSPDLMLARGDGGWQWVLGEMHLAMNTLENRVFHTQADDAPALNAAIGTDMSSGRVVALPPLDSPEVSPRTYPPLASHSPDAYHYWSYGADCGAPEGARSVPAAAVRVHDEDGILVAAPVDGSWRAPLIEVLGEFLSALVVNRFHIRPPAQQQGRVLIDDLVVCRAAWRFGADELAVPPERATELAARLRERGLPRHVFARTPAEPKPCYVDLDAPWLVRNLVRMVHLLADRPDGERWVAFTEMLPGPDELWLADAQGRQYTSELRMVALDETCSAPVTVGRTR